VKKFNLAKEFLFNGVLIGVLSIGLASCGGGGGGGSGSTSLSFGGSGPSTPGSGGGGGSGSSTPTSFSTYLYSGTDYPNEPIITVYIDGQAVKLLADTGSSGLVVNSSAVNIPSSNIYNSYSFGAPFSLNGYYYGNVSGTMASATVCLNPSIPNSCVKMPIGLLSPSDDPFPSTGEAQGDFGLASGLNSMDIGYNDSSSSATIGLSYPTYLESKYGINSYTIGFYPLSNGYYSSTVSSTIPIGYISFGVYNGNSNTLISYTVDPYFFPFNPPFAFVYFPSSNSSTPSFTGVFTFDTGFSYNLVAQPAFQAEIPNFSQSADTGDCNNYTDSIYTTNQPLYDIANGGISITYSLQENSGSFYSGTFTTEPSSSFCEANIPFTLMEGVTLDSLVIVPSTNGLVGEEIFGLPAMLGHTFTFVLGTSVTYQGLGTYQGLVQDIGISP
jgi:hypothetical protein